MFDLIIRGARVIDGAGSCWFYADVAISGDRIAAVGQLTNARARRIIECPGKVVCPGFIDMHTHSDLFLLAEPEHNPKVRQGVTTEVIGLDGLSYAPLSEANLAMTRDYLSALNGAPEITYDWQSVAEFLSRFDRQTATNVVYLIPHNALRLEVMGFEPRPADKGECDAMRRLLKEGMDQGAVGFSTGLDYYPGRYSETDELIQICQELVRCGGVSVWHVRARDLGLFGGIEEVIKVAEATGVKTHFSHYAANGSANWGRAGELLEIIDKARAQGLDVTFDAYPYDASSTTMNILLPGWVHAGGTTEMLERLGDADIRKRIADEVGTDGWDRIVVACVGKGKNETYIGRSLLEAADMAGLAPVEFVCRLMLEESLNAGYVSHLGNEADLQTIIQHPAHTGGSDGLLVGQKPNPRGWGTFPRFLGRYFRDQGILTLEEGIRHLTAASAQRLGLSDRGLIKSGLAADLVVFDPGVVEDRATFDNPTQYPAGIDYVVVNGAVVIDNGMHSGLLNGRVLSG
jgi:N-acyl-D-amino-acid deacylase